MTNIELLIQVKEITNVINNASGLKPPNKTLLDFEVASYSISDVSLPSMLNKEKNVLLTFGNMSDFAISNIKKEDYILVKGDLREVSNNENIFLPISIQKIGDKKKSAKITNNEKMLSL